MQKTYCIIMTTVANKDDACKLTATLLELQLAACVQHIPMESYYTFEEQECAEAEILMLIKTRQELYGTIETVIAAKHPYKVPELLMLPVEKGLGAYLDWIDLSTGLVRP